LLLDFKTPLFISEMLEARDFKFSMAIGLEGWSLVVTNVIYSFEKTGYLRLFMPKKLFIFFRKYLFF